MSRWQKRARYVLVALVLGVVALVVFTLGERRPQETPAPVERVDPTAVSESSGVQLTQATGLKVPGIVDAERSLTYADGSAKLLGAKITSDRAGQQFVVTGKEALVGPDQSNVKLTGDVTLSSSDGLKAETQEASYSRGDGVVRANGEVRFTKGAITGRAVGMTYDQQRDVLWLLDQAVIDVAPGTDTGGGAEIRAGTAGYARRDKYMRFERGVTMLREGRTIESESALAFLSDDESHLRSMELRGQSRIVTTGSVEGGLSAMRARDMNLTYGPDGEALERAVLSGDAAIQLAGAGGGPGRRIAGEFIDVAFGPDGEVTTLNARDRVELRLPAQKDAPERTIRAAAMEGRGETGRGLTGARFLDGVEFREQGAGGAARVARARTLDVAMQPGSGAIEDARFQGSTRFEEGALRASAANGRYQVTRGVLELTGAENGKDPRVEDERIAVDATRIDLTFEGPRLLATGAVRSVLRPEKPEKTRDPAATARAGQGMLRNDQDVMVTAKSLDYDGSKSFATYTGGARLWQADTTIQGETIILDEKSGDLKASGSVRSAFVLEQADDTGTGTKKVPSLASAKDLHYEDALRRATYTTDAHVNGPQGDCHAEKIELYFAESGGSLERAEAYQNVRLLADARTATGSRMTYFAADEKYVMTGEPVKTVDAECRETTGKTLTFFRSADRILVDGNEEIRTLTKSAGTCAQSR